MMRTLRVVLVICAACELQPPPKNQPAPVVPTAPPTPAPAPDAELVVPPAAPPAGAAGEAGSAGSGAPAIAITPGCLATGKHLATVLIANTMDPAQKSIFEQERDNIVRSFGEACVTQAWSNAALECYLATKTPREIQTCEQRFPAPKPAPQLPGAGSAA